VRDDLGPRLEPVLGQSAHGQHELATGDDVLKAGAPIAQRPPGGLAAILVK
jgi:hypothetical protein